MIVSTSVEQCKGDCFNSSCPENYCQRSHDSEKEVADTDTVSHQSESFEAREVGKKTEADRLCASKTCFSFNHFYKKENDFIFKTTHNFLININSEDV